LRKSAEIPAELRVPAGQQDFVCPADAITAAEKLSAKMKWYELSNIQTVENHIMPIGVNQSLMRCQQRGLSDYRIRDLWAQKSRHGYLAEFILATNILDSAQFSKDDALREYKAPAGY
jgi:hypothetical protein